MLRVNPLDRLKFIVSGLLMFLAGGIELLAAVNLHHTDADTPWVLALVLPLCLVYKAAFMAARCRYEDDDDG